MKQQISRLSPHQNAKVFGVLMAVGSLVFVLPLVLLASAFGPKENQAPVIMFLILPVFYLVFGYLMVAVSCWLYNFMVRYVGGIEFEAKGTEA